MIKHIPFEKTKSVIIPGIADVIANNVDALVPCSAEVSGLDGTISGYNIFRLDCSVPKLTTKLCNLLLTLLY